jgi:predicted nucleotidyltransferase
MIQVKQKIQSKASILEIIQGIFPNTTVMFIYYCGSLAFGLNDENSDDDVTVVLDGFKGNVHLSLGKLDVFAYGRDIYLKKQNLDSTVPLYDRAYIDEVLSEKDNLIYLDENYREEYEAYKNVDLTSKLGLFLDSFVEHYKMRIEYPEPQKSHYHIFRVRGILDHVDQVGKYRLVVHEPWYTMMTEYKKNWNNNKGMEYMPLLREALTYIENYKDKVMHDELGKHPQSI